MSKTTAILCLIGLLAGMTHNAWDMLTERNQFRTENRKLSRDVEKLSDAGIEAQEGGQ